jgi:hypothetical protein
MANMNRSISAQTALEIVEKQFEAWRSGRANKREPIPGHLWQAAAGLCRQYSLARVSRELHLSYTDLKKRIRNGNSTSARFVEIDTTFPGGQWQIECSRVDGSCLRMTGYGFPPEIDSLLRSFLP